MQIGAIVPPSSLIAEALRVYDNDSCKFFTECTSIDTPDYAWQLTQLSLIRGGLGHRYLSHHCSAAYIAFPHSINSNHHLVSSIQRYNLLVPVAEAVSVEAKNIGPPDL